uniref:Cardiolipin synthase n=1 Tax=Parascaris univalens TaxID=6257 RepID=A0A915BSK0_PARUN
MTIRFEPVALFFSENFLPIHFSRALSCLSIVDEELIDSRWSIRRIEVFHFIAISPR